MADDLCYPNGMALQFPKIFEPDPRKLLSAVASHIDNSMLLEIAKADYGDQIEEHLAALRPVRDQNLAPSEAWVPSEVLELVRWSEPDQPDWHPGGRGERGHWMRAFCCVALLRMEGERLIRFGIEDTTAILVESVEILNAGLWDELGALLTWLVDQTANSDYDSQDPVLGVALLQCVLRIESVTDASIIALCEWTWAREKEQSTLLAFDGSWFHRVVTYSVRQRTWRSLESKMMTLDLQARSKDVRDWVGKIGAALAEG